MITYACSFRNRRLSSCWGTKEAASLRIWLQSRYHELSHIAQQATPLAEALNAQRINRLAHFDVPGHKGGRMNPELPDYFGSLCMSLDVN